MDYTAVIFCAHLVAVKCEVFTTTSTREIQLCARPATQLTCSPRQISHTPVHCACAKILSEGVCSDTDLICILAYIDQWFHSAQSAVEKRWSVTESDLQAWLPAACYAREALFFIFFSFFADYGLLVEPHEVCSFGMADWLNRLLTFIIYIVFLIKKIFVVVIPNMSTRHPRTWSPTSSSKLHAADTL